MAITVIWILKLWKIYISIVLLMSIITKIIYKCIFVLRYFNFPSVYVNATCAIIFITLICF